MQGLIVAAGQGSRLRTVAPSKPLASVNGVPLIQHVIEAARLGGVDRFVVVTGYRAGPLEQFLARMAGRLGIPIETVFNARWELANGLSVTAARGDLEPHFVLMMSDHLFEPGLLSDLIGSGPVVGGAALAVDRRLSNPLVDLDDVTRVRTDGAGVISAVGKGLTPYDAFDTGLFLASSALLDAIEADHVAGGAGSITAGMNRLAAEGLARAHDIGERFWLDVDDPTAHAQAERLTA
ncbi:MAG TPA: NTP transferase domain-containing protein [Caulobacteraceae bacterium]|jgi:choline kinase|nr:NTP transferase domain-containing protein [Caulobacteraceae bacterium]